jgi:hypothetical protein
MVVKELILSFDIFIRNPQPATRNPYFTPSTPQSLDSVFLCALRASTRTIFLLVSIREICVFFLFMYSDNIVVLWQVLALEFSLVQMGNIAIKIVFERSIRTLTGG